MDTRFAQILRGDAPSHMVWSDTVCGAFLSNEPVRPGHVLIVPRLKVDHWVDLPPDVLLHLYVVAQRLGRALRNAFDAPQVGLIIAGFDIAHAHLHVIPAEVAEEVRLADADRNPDPADLDAAHRQVLQELVPMHPDRPPLRGGRSCVTHSGIPGGEDNDEMGVVVDAPEQGSA